MVASGCHVDARNECGHDGAGIDLYLPNESVHYDRQQLFPPWAIARTFVKGQQRTIVISNVKTHEE
jgi:hypothetical protein